MAPTAMNQRSARFNELFTATHGRVVGYVLRRGAVPADADDVVADVYVVAWRRFDDIPWDEPLPWLFGVARNMHRNQQRSRRRGDALLERLRRQPGPGDESVTETDDLAGVRRALAALTESDREMLHLAAVEGLAPTQIARVLRCRPATARVRLHRARRRLRALLESPEHSSKTVGSLPTAPSGRTGS